MQTFSSFSNETGFIHSGLLIRKENKYLPYRAFNLDAQTLFNFCSSADYWKGTVEEIGKWNVYSRSNNTLSPFLQLFISIKKEIIQNLYILCYNFNNCDFILIGTTVNEKIPEEKLPDPNSILNYSADFLNPWQNLNKLENLEQKFKDKKCYIFEIDLESILKKQMIQLQVKNSDLEESIKETFKIELGEKIASVIENENPCIIFQKKILCFIFTNVKLNLQMFHAALSNETSDILPAVFFDEQCIKYLTGTKNLTEIKNILKK